MPRSPRGRPPEDDNGGGAPGSGKQGEAKASPGNTSSNPLGSRAQRGANLAKFSASTGSGYLASRVRRLRQGDAADAQFHAETAEKMVEMLGSMKGAAMKLGQIASFVDLDLPPEAQETYHQVLAQLRAAAPAVDPAEIADVVEQEFGAPPDRVFEHWEETPIASASIGQVHRAVLPDGTHVVTKVQYPGIAEAVQSDLANVEMFAPLTKVMAPNLRIRPLMEEMRHRLLDELDYQQEAQYQQAFVDRYDGHPFIRVPEVHHDYCRPRVLTSTFAEGVSFEEMLGGSDEEQRQRYGEIIYRFVFGSLNRFRLFNGDPHPGNYLFPGDGTVVFIDFGSVKLFRSMTRDHIKRQMKAVMANDVPGLLDLLREAKFIAPEQEVDGEQIMGWFRTFNEPVISDREWTYTPDFARDVIKTTTDPRLGYVEMLRKLNLPPDYLLLNRIQWGVNSILGRLRACANWYRINEEFWGGGEPATALGEEEAAFMRASAYLA